MLQKLSEEVLQGGRRDPSVLGAVIGQIGRQLQIGIGCRRWRSLVTLAREHLVERWRREAGWSKSTRRRHVGGRKF